MTEINQSDFHHSELQKPRTEKDDKAVSDVVDVLQNWINPLEQPFNSNCCSTGDRKGSNGSIQYWRRSIQLF